MLDFNRANISETPLSLAINALIEAAEPPEQSNRKYLGASAVGSECLRRVQYDWLCDPQHPTRTRDIFARGHYFEEVSRQHLIRAGFDFAPAERLSFAAAKQRSHELAAALINFSAESKERIFGFIDDTWQLASGKDNLRPGSGRCSADASRRSALLRPPFLHGSLRPAADQHIWRRCHLGGGLTHP